MAVQLTEMSDREYRHRRAGMIRDLALTLAATRGRSVPEAEAEAVRVTAGSLDQRAMIAGLEAELVRHGIRSLGLVSQRMAEILPAR